MIFDKGAVCVLITRPLLLMEETVVSVELIIILCEVEMNRDRRAFICYYLLGRHGNATKNKNGQLGGVCYLLITSRDREVYKADKVLKIRSIFSDDDIVCANIG